MTTAEVGVRVEEGVMLKLELESIGAKVRICRLIYSIFKSVTFINQACIFLRNIMPGDRHK